MVHVLVWVGDPPIRTLLQEALEDEGCTVTVADDFWGTLAVLRASLHPLVAILGDWGLHNLGQPEAQALAAQRDALLMHQYIEIRFWASVPATSPARMLYDDATVEVLPGPFGIDDLLCCLQRAAARLSSPKAT